MRILPRALPIAESRVNPYRWLQHFAIMGMCGIVLQKRGGTAMSIGTGVVLFVIGAILVFALNIEVQGIDLDMVGYILMGAGVVVFVIGLVLLTRRRRSDVVTRTEVDPGAPGSVSRRSVTSRDDDVV